MRGRSHRCQLASRGTQNKEHWRWQLVAAQRNLRRTGLRSLAALRAGDSQLRAVSAGSGRRAHGKGQAGRARRQSGGGPGGVAVSTRVNAGTAAFAPGSFSCTGHSMLIVVCHIHVDV